MGRRRVTNGKQGQRKRVLIKGEYPILPQGTCWFELVLYFGYKDVLPRDEAAIDEALGLGVTDGCEVAEPRDNAVQDGRGQVGAPDPRLGTPGERELRQGEFKWTSEEPDGPAWEDTEAPAPPGEER